MDGNRLKIRQLIDSYDPTNIELAVTIAEGIGKRHWIKEDYLNVANWLESLVFHPTNRTMHKSETVEKILFLVDVLKRESRDLMFTHLPATSPRRLFAMYPPKMIQFQGVRLTEIPNYIFEWTSLEELFFWNAQMQQLPTAIGQLEQLRILSFGNSNFQILPDELGKLQKLESLNCQGNQLTDLPDTLHQLPKLASIDCDDNPFTEVPKVLYRMKHLDNLWIKGTNIPEKELQDLERALSSNCRISWNHTDDDKLPF